MFFNGITGCTLVSLQLFDSIIIVFVMIIIVFVMIIIVFVMIIIVFVMIILFSLHFLLQLVLIWIRSGRCMDVILSRDLNNMGGGGVAEFSSKSNKR